MPVAYARAQMLNRSAGRTALERLAYIARLRMRIGPGRIADHTQRRDRAGPLETLLPPGGAPILSDAERMWRLVQRSSTHPRAVHGFELILSLPTLDELDIDTSRAMLRAFLQQLFVTNWSLPVSFALHLPPGHAEASVEPSERDDFDPFASALDEDALNLHAHVLVPPRQLHADRFAKARYTEFDAYPLSDGRQMGPDWGRIWGDHQNRTFAELGLDLRVRPRLPLQAPAVSRRAIQRRRRRQRNSPAKGREKLASPQFEQAVAERLLFTETGLLEALGTPFSRTELESLALRVAPAREARAQLNRTLGLAETIRLGDADTGSASRWHASIFGVQRETAAFGLAAALGTRRSMWRADLPTAGTRAAARAIGRALFAGSDLSIIDAHQDPSGLVADLVWLAREFAGKPVISVGHRSGAPQRKQARRLAIEDLATGPVTDALVIVEDPDALAPDALALLANAAICGANKLVLVARRDDAAIWAPSDLLRLIRPFAQSLVLGSPPPENAQTLFAARRTEEAVAWLRQTGRVSAFDPDEPEHVILAHARRRTASGRSCTIVAADPDLRQSLRRRLDSDIALASVLPRKGECPVLLVIGKQGDGDAPLAAGLERYPDLDIVFDPRHIPSLRALAQRLRFENGIGAAIAHPLFDRASGAGIAGSSSTLGPRHTVDWDGSSVLGATAIAAMTRFWAAAEDPLPWSRFEERDTFIGKALEEVFARMADLEIEHRRELRWDPDFDRPFASAPAAPDVNAAEPDMEQDLQVATDFDDDPDPEALHVPSRAGVGLENESDETPNPDGSADEDYEW